MFLPEMELIANLEKSRATERFTPENLKRLEQIFQDAVGGKNEIDFENFKKIVQSKNSFFVERIFHIFDADHSGAISLEEFMKVMHCFANQSPAEKLQYLFDIYDLNNDGNIQFSELRNVISECMKENGLKFDESEIDELTNMLFHDADTDNNGTITFTEFKDQLERHPSFMENLTQSIERWLMPPIKEAKVNPGCKIFDLRKVQWQYIRNNWTNVAFLLLYFIINFSLFSSRVYQYWHTNGYVIIARACGQCLNFNCSFITLLILRKTLTWLRTHGFSQYFPIDQHLYYHKLAGCSILFFATLHTVTHVVNLSMESEELKVPLDELLISTHFNIGWIGGAAPLTGWIILSSLIIMFFSSMPFVRRHGKFEIFHCLHLLYVVFWVCLILHCPNFWKWFVGPALLFIIECAFRATRNLSSNNVTYVQQGILLPSKVTHLVIKRPPKFDYRPGDYVYVCVPAIAKFEWHPFTISSAPELDDVLWLHIRGVGEWTNGLYNYFVREDREAVMSDDLLRNLEVSNKQKSPTVSIFESSMEPTKLSESLIKKERYKKHLALNIRKSCSRDPNFDKLSWSCNSLNATVIEMEKKNLTFNFDSKEDKQINAIGISPGNLWHRTSFSSSSTSRAIQHKNKEDIKNILAHHRDEAVSDVNSSRLSVNWVPREKRKSVRISVAQRGLRKCQTVIVMPTVSEEDEDLEFKMEEVKDISLFEEEMKDLQRESEEENIVLSQEPLKIYLDGPYGSPTRHIFQAKHAVLIGTGIGVTPFASILQSIMCQYRKSRHTCPTCYHKWSDPKPVTSMRLQKVDFFWLNRHQRAFEWFVNLLSELEVEQAQLEENDRFLDIHMYITSALHTTDMKAVGLQIALDLLYQKEKRDLITGLKSRTQPGRPDWNKVFTNISEQKKGKVTVFFCGADKLAETLQAKCDEFGFKFRKEIF